jgi:hypothetical protein
MEAEEVDVKPLSAKRKDMKKHVIHEGPRRNALVLFALRVS